MLMMFLLTALVVLLLARVPVAWSILFPCVVYILMTPGMDLELIVQRFVAGLNSYPLLAIPFFILLGFAANAFGITNRIFNLAQAALAPVRGALGYVNVLTSLVFSWMSGSALADAAGLGAMQVPAMKKRGYDEKFAVGLTGASAIIGPVMPPSVPAIIYAATAGVSVGSVFLAGVVPAFIMAALLCFSVYLYARKRPELTHGRFETKTVVRLISKTLPIFGGPILILGGIFGGFFSPTEAGAVGAAYILLLAVFYREWAWKKFLSVLSDTARTTANIALIIGSAGLLSWIMAREGIPQTITGTMQSLTSSPIIFLLLVNVFLLLIGTFLEATSAIILVVPTLLPAAVSFGIDPVQFGIIVVINLMIGLLTPPIGLMIFILSEVTAIDYIKVALALLKFYVPLLIVLAFVTMMALL